MHHLTEAEKTHHARVRKASIKKQSLADLLAKDLGPRDHLLSPWLREQDSAMIWAAPGVGKTMFTLALALTIAGGGRFMGWSAEKPRKVLLVDGEMPEHDLQARLRMLAGAVRGIDLDAAGCNLEIIARHAQAPEQEFIDLADPVWADELIHQLQRPGSKPDLVIFDNLSTLAQLDDENSTAATGPLVKLLSRIKQARIACMVVHHSNKAGDHYRGASNLATTFEVIIGLVRPKTVLDVEGRARFDIDWTKYRGRRDATTVPMRIALEELPDGAVQWTSSCPEGMLFDAIEEIVKSATCKTWQDVQKRLPGHLRGGESKQWMSNQKQKFIAHGRMTEREIARCFEAARNGGLEAEDNDENDDF